jgi:plastocyanin
MRVSRWARFAALPLAAVLLVAAGCGDDSGDDTAKSGDASTTTVSVPKGIEVGAGINDPKDPNIAVLQFLPSEVTVAVGSDVTWQWDGTEPHSVTFLKPGQTLPDPGSDPSLFAPTPATGPIDGTAFVNSGLLPLDANDVPPLTLSFAKAGTYQYHCVIHPQMVGTVTVTDDATAADSPADVAQARAADTAKWLAEGRAAKAAFERSKPESAKNDDGSTTWTVQMGTSTAHTDILAFQPTPADVKAGDTVTFVNGSAAPHTASFFGTGAEPITDPTDPKTDAPAPGPSPQTLAAAGFFNTGLLPPDAPPGAGPPLAARSFSFTVPDPGTYGYVCILHSPSGMAGTITAT